jgi:two-component system sensor histidine kinase TctE
MRYGRSAQPRVTVSISREEGDTVLAVTDNGPGLSGQDADSLSRRWAQGASGKKLGAGAGLGLAIVQRYAQLMGASFQMRAAKEGTGLCAMVRFPEPPPPAPPEDQASAG